MLKIENDKITGYISLDTVLDPITKSNPNGRHIKIKDFRLLCDGLDIEKLESKATSQIGIEVRAKVRDWNAEDIRKLIGARRKWDEWFTGKNIGKMSNEALVNKIAGKKSAEDLDDLIRKLEAMKKLKSVTS